MKSIIFFLFFLFISETLQAQHCPFDGTHLVAIKVVNNQGKMVTNFNGSFYLIEVDNPMADSCSSAAGLITKQFLIKDTFIAQCNNRFDRNGYNKELYNRLTQAGVFANANMMVNLNQAENTCTLIGKSKSKTGYANDLYLQRKFVIVFMLNNKELRQALPGKFIYSLCTGVNKIEKFKPMIIKL